MLNILLQVLYDTFLTCINLRLLAHKHRLQNALCLLAYGIKLAMHESQSPGHGGASATQEVPCTYQHTLVPYCLILETGVHISGFSGVVMLSAGPNSQLLDFHEQQLFSI